MIAIRPPRDDPIPALRASIKAANRRGYRPPYRKQFIKAQMIRHGWWLVAGRWTKR